MVEPIQGEAGKDEPPGLRSMRFFFEVCSFRTTVIWLESERFAADATSFGSPMKFKLVSVERESQSKEERRNLD